MVYPVYIEFRRKQQDGLIQVDIEIWWYYTIFSKSLLLVMMRLLISGLVNYKIWSTHLLRVLIVEQELFVHQGRFSPPRCLWVRVAQPFLFSVVFCRSLFVRCLFLLLTIVLRVSRFTAFHIYGTFKVYFTSMFTVFVTGRMYFILKILCIVTE